MLSAGTLVHAVLEELIALEPSERTVDRAREIYTEQWAVLDPQLGERVNRIELRERAGTALRSYFELEDPAAVEVIPDGLERKVSATIGGVEIAGTVDRIQFADAGRARPRLQDRRRPSRSTPPPTGGSCCSTPRCSPTRAPTSPTSR